MGTITLQVPTVGLPNSTEDPKITSDMNTLQTLLNGNLDTNNLSPTAGILPAQINGTLGLQYGGSSGNFAVSPNQLLVMTGSPSIATLPAPTVNTYCGVMAFGATGPAPVTVQASGGALIYGVNVAANNLVLGITGAFVTLLANGSNWVIISGQVDTGWQGMAPSAGISSAGCNTRTIGDQVFMKGLVQNISGGIVGGFGSTLITVGSGAHPPVDKYCSMASPNFAPTVAKISQAGNLSILGSMGNFQFVSLDGVSYSVS